MTHPQKVDLSRLFAAVSQRLEAEREALNRAGPAHGRHGDHMVEAFQTAAAAVQEESAAGLPFAMRQAAGRLAELERNESAQIYGRALAQFAAQFEKQGIDLEDLAAYVQDLLKTEENKAKEDETAEGDTTAPAVTLSGKGRVLKALVAGLAAWQQLESGQEPAPNAMDLGYLFELGMAYMQAKQKGGSKAEILAEAAVSASPLGKTPYRAQSGKIAIRSFLEAFQS